MALEKKQRDPSTKKEAGKKADPNKRAAESCQETATKKSAGE
jgi:hypothetical protein